MTNPWSKSNTRLTAAGHRHRAWICELDVEDPNGEIEPAHLFNPFTWQAVRGRQLNDRTFASSLAVGDVVRIVRQCGPDPYDVDLVVRSVLPAGAGVVMGLRGAHTDMASICAAENNAAAARKQSAKEAAEKMMTIDGGELR